MKSWKIGALIGFLFAPGLLLFGYLIFYAAHYLRIKPLLLIVGPIAGSAIYPGVVLRRLGLTLIPPLYISILIWTLLGILIVLGLKKR
jgi:hypothetical protein